MVTARRLDTARATVDPSLGASTYTLTNDAVENRPGGETTTLNQVLLQVPGVSQVGDGQLRIRGQGDLQYRINNIIVPDGLSDLGDSLSARLVDRVQLVTGALPAQYGLHAGGVVNITTKSGVFDQGGQVELYGGSQGEVEPAFEFGGAWGATNLFVSGSYMHNNVGLDAPDSGANPSHDRTDQAEGFAFLDHVIDPQTRVSLILGTSHERFQLPKVQDLPVGSTALGDQSQDAQYGLLSLLHSTERFTLQLSAFTRYSRLDDRADLISPGLIQSARVTDMTGGLQLESVYQASARHTVRAGLVVSDDSGSSRTTALAASVRSNDHRTEASGFAQDEWRAFDALTVNGGLRFDHVSGVGGDAQLSPRINLVWTPLEGLDVHGGYARYFVPAPQNEGGLVLGSDGLRAETDDYFDLGVQQTVGRLTLGADGYTRHAKNLVADAPLGEGALRQSHNFGTGRSRGVEFSLTYAQGPFSAWSNLSVSRTEGRTIVSERARFSAADLAATDGRFVPIDQDQTYTASAGATYHWRVLRLSSDLTYGSGLRRTEAGGAVNGDSLPAHVQVNLSGVLHLAGFGGKPIDLRLDVINALDAKYQLRDGAALGGGLPQWGGRRGFFFGAEQSF